MILVVNKKERVDTKHTKKDDYRTICMQIRNGNNGVNKCEVYCYIITQAEHMSQRSYGSADFGCTGVTAM